MASTLRSTLKETEENAERSLGKLRDEVRPTFESQVERLWKIGSKETQILKVDAEDENRQSRVFTLC